MDRASRRWWRGTGIVALLALLLGACGGARIPHAQILQPARTDLGRDPEAIFQALQGVRFARAEEWEAAAGAFRRAIRQDPEAPQLHLWLASVLAHLPLSRSEGLLSCVRAGDLGADPTEVVLCRSRILESVGEPEAALVVLNEVPLEAATPLVFRTRVRLGGQIAPERAQAEAQAWTRAREGESEAWRTLGFALSEDDSPAAAAAWQRAMLLPGGNDDDAYRAIQSYAEAEMWAQALGASVECSERFREYWPCVSWQVRLLAAPDTGAGDGLQEAIERLAFLTSSDDRAIGSAGAELRKDVPLVTQQRWVAALVRMRPDNIQTLIGGAWALHFSQDEDGALELMEHVVELDDSNFEALNFVGYTWANRGVRLDDAEAWIRRAVFLRGDDGGILDSLAWVLFRQDRLEEALEVQERALELVPDNAVLLDHYGDILHALGHLDEALIAWERAVALAGEWDENVLVETPLKLEALRLQLGE